MVSKKTKQPGIVELTVPKEDRVEVSGELKRLKYEPIVQEGWELTRQEVKFLKAP